ncbi:GntR family transcriptional regulator [Vagococcus humatus]|uniref:GntR family transcriptional regulator n=1 Tax=Vagococcus humatus TaxID=1889241 RepID=A0A3S0AD97_9ENTE|nr:GntR family transcriptional regulator [Vagococcus humatus]RST90069.1 GntR family transcriptional regulator [Vagococcus humatus]
MDIVVDIQAKEPIYEQIYLQIKQQILLGELNSLEALPSIRKLANDLDVSVITTRKAYDELINENLVVSVKGKGMYVGQIDRLFIQQNYQKELKKQIRALKEEASIYGVDGAMFREIFSQVLEERTDI